jgi:hypothetical protein
MLGICEQNALILWRCPTNMDENAGIAQKTAASIATDWV